MIKRVRREQTFLNHENLCGIRTCRQQSAVSSKRTVGYCLPHKAQLVFLYRAPVDVPGIMQYNRFNFVKKNKA